MASWQELRTKLEELLGSKNVYYNPPESIKIEYPAIVFFRSRIDTKKANNSTYKKAKRYDITVISREPDHPVIDKLLELQYCSYDRNFKSDNLEHDILTLYY